MVSVQRFRVLLRHPELTSALDRCSCREPTHLVALAPSFFEQSMTSIGTRLPPELERRIAELEDPAHQGAGFKIADWVLLLVTDVVLPLLLLLWGWPR